MGKALPALDVVFGGKQMIEGIQNGDTFSAITGGASALGGTMMLAGGALSGTGIGAVIGGPLLVGGTVLTAGAAVADVVKWGWDNREAIGDAFSTAKDAVVDFAKDPIGTTTEAVGNFAEGAADVLSDVGNGVKNLFGW